MGNVARLLSGASIEPRMLAVAMTPVLLPPASACPPASTSALRLARLSPLRASKDVSATADIILLRQGIRAEWDGRSNDCDRMALLPKCKAGLSEMAVGSSEEVQRLSFRIEEPGRRVAFNNPADLRNGNADLCGGTLE